MKSLIILVLFGAALLSASTIDSFLGSSLCASRGNKCGGNSGQSCCSGLSCEDDFGGYGVCIGNTLCSSRGESCDSDHPCCGSLSCEDNPGVCIGNDEENLAASLCANQGNKCGGTSGKSCCSGLSCEDNFGGFGVCVGNAVCSSRGQSCDTKHPCCGSLSCEDNPGVCVGNDEENLAVHETENFVCAGVGKACAGANEDGMFCCPGSECEDNFNGHGVCVAVHTTSNFVCSGAGQACGGTTENAFFCCPGYECEDNFNGHGVCVKVNTTLCAKVGQACDGNSGNSCCDGYQCEDNFNGHGVCVA